MNLLRNQAGRRFDPASLLRQLAVCLLLLGACSVAVTAQDDGGSESSDDPLAVAQEHSQKGRYAEALEVYEALPGDRATEPAVILTRSRCLEAQGDYEAATVLVADAVKTAPQPMLLGRLAELQLERGQYGAARQSIAEALALDEDQPLARAVQIDLLLATGQAKEAEEASRWFIDYYNRAQPEDAETLLLVARGVTLFAIWHPKSRNLDMIINTLCPDAIKAEPDCWQAHALAGGLLLDKYNRAQGMPELKKALAINPQAAPVFARLARTEIDDHDPAEAQPFVDRALEINPRLVSALLARSDIEREAGELQKAEQSIRDALAVNPHHESALARLAILSLQAGPLPDSEELNAVFARLDAGEPMGDAPRSEFSRLLARVAEVNPHPGKFLEEVGSALEGAFKFEFAERCYREAARTLPQLPGPRTALGLLSMRTGRLDEAREILDEAFTADPFHVRVSNMRKVVKLLDGYQVLETPHFRIRYDSEADAILARYMGEYLESQYSPLVEQFRFEPPEKTQFELFHRAKGVSAHQWFSARLVGLPWIQTIGASTGMIVALSSPTASDRPYNWARVVKHEFVHIVTLQGTKFNIPHWYTEALAVLAEETPRPELWNSLLRERVPAGKLLNLDNLNQGFQRAKNQNDWNFAYCQARLYAEYLMELFGQDATSRLLEAYRQGMSTTEALRQVFGIEQAVFEQGYRDYLDRVVAQLNGEVPEEPPHNLPLAEKEYRDDPENPDKAGHYALSLLNVNKRKEARKIAETVLEKHPGSPQASLVLARLALRAEDVKAAEELLDAALDLKKPDPRVLELRAEVYLGSKQYSEAAALYELGLKQAPLHVPWQKGLATALLRARDYERLKPVLEQLAVSDGDDALVRRKRAEIALAEKDFQTAASFARLALHIDVMNVETHEILAEALGGLGQLSEAVKEWEIATEIKPKEARLVVDLSRALKAAGRQTEAIERLKALLEVDPGHEPASKLLKELETP